MRPSGVNDMATTNGGAGKRLADRLSRGRIHEPQGSRALGLIGPGNRQRLSGGARRYVADRTDTGVRLAGGRTVREVPEREHAILTTEDEGFAVRTEGDRRSCEGVPARLAGSAVPQSDRAVPVDRRQGLAVGAERDTGRLGTLVAENSPNASASLRRGDERAARLHDGPRPVGLEREQEREIEPAVEVRDRLTGELASLSELALVVYATRLPDGEQRRYDRRDEQQRQHDRQHPQPACAFARDLELVALGVPATNEELPLELVHLAQVLGAPVERGSEARAPVELRGVTAPLFPGAGGPHQVLVQAAARDVVLEPSTQPGPFPQQGLVGDLDRAFADRQQTAVRELSENDPGILVRVEVELGEGCATSHRPLRLAGGKPQQHAASDPLLGLAQPSIGALGQPAHRAADAAARLVPFQLQRAPVPLLPELEERRRQKRERTRLVSDVGDKGVDEPWLDAKPCPARRQLDRPAQLLGLHRPDEHMVRAEQVGEVRVGSAAAVEGGPNCEY